jgi:hypothetical protein
MKRMIWIVLAIVVGLVVGLNVDALTSWRDTAIAADTPQAEPAQADTEAGIEFREDWTDFIKESDEEWSQYGNPDAVPDVEKLRDIILKNQSFELDRMPVGYWTYLSFHGDTAEHITEQEVADWAAIGATVMKGPEWNPDNPEHYAGMMQLLDWCEDYNIKLMIRDGRTSPGRDGAPSRVLESRDDVAQHPAFFGYHICDEPHALAEDGGKGLTDHCQNIQQNIEGGRPYINGGPFHPGVEDFLGVESYEEYIDIFGRDGNVDFLAFDIYDQMFRGRAGWNAYFANLRLYREGGWRHGLPYWITPISSGHFAYEPPTFDDYRWQMNSSVASGAQGILWFFYYMREPHLNYIDPPVDEFWEKTQTWDDMRKVHQAFHKRYGDLFMNLASTRVTFLPGGYGGGIEYTGNEVTRMVIAANDTTAPAILGEFVDMEGQRYIMLVNLHRTDSVWWSIAFPGDDVEIYQYTWEGEERPGAASAASKFERGERTGNIGVGYWLRPGQAIVQRVDSTMIRESELTLAMRELNGLDPQGPLDLELAIQRLAEAEARVEALTDDDTEGHTAWCHRSLEEAKAKLTDVQAKRAVGEDIVIEEVTAE